MPHAPSPSPILPVVAIISDRTQFHGHPAHLALDGYVRAVREAAQAFPVLLPASAEGTDAATLIASVDGVVLAGSPSNVAAERYGAEALPEGTAQDHARDATALPLIPQLVAAGVPLLGVCRGLQEINVAFGGSLHRAVHDLPGMLDHREGDTSRPIEDWYEDRHEIEIVPGGALAPLADAGSATVNSLHHQGVDRLGRGLRVEATAPDGLIEAFSVAGARRFALAVQWHPEMRVREGGLARAIFAAFGAACVRRALERTAAGPGPSPAGAAPLRPARPKSAPPPHQDERTSDLRRFQR